jgi:tyrosine-protein phosphatase YwqE
MEQFESKIRKDKQMVRDIRYTKSQELSPLGALYGTLVFNKDQILSDARQNIE